jgi:hypothetical protein
MSNKQSRVLSVRLAPADMAEEIEAVFPQFCIFMNGQDSALSFSPTPPFLSLPDFPELAAYAHVILERMGRSVDGVDMAQADDCVFRLPRYAKQALSDMPSPQSAEDLSELLNRISARLEAVAWDLNGLRELGAWCDANPDKGARVCLALRIIASYSMGYGRGGRE